MKKAGVYKITNIVNSKVYIGSSGNIDSRIKGHIIKLKSNKHCNKHLQSAWNKYGQENFKFEVLELVEDINLLIQCEQKYIDLYNSAITGYNKRKIADSNFGNRWTLEARERLSKSKLGIKAHKNQIKSVIGNKFNKGGYKLSEVFRAKRRKISKLFWKNIPLKKKKLIFNKISKSRKGIPNPKAVISDACRLKANKSLMKSIDQFDLKGNFIKTWESSSEAIIALNLQSSNLSKVLKGKRFKTGGFIFKYHKKSI